MTHNPTPKALTNDEKKAADAAFAGRPFNAAWSAAARAVYDGIVNALPKEVVEATPEVDAILAELDVTSPAAPSLETATPAGTDVPQASAEADAPAEPVESSVPTIKDRQEAIQSGVLIDVTPAAKELGLTFPITITKPLWDIGIVTSQSLSQEEQTGRLRDILMAFRLRLASLATVSPLIDFPALLAIPPSTVPQPVPLFAIIQPDNGNQANVTLLLPNEVSLTITPSN